MLLLCVLLLCLCVCVCVCVCVCRYLDHLSITWEAMYGNEPCETISDDKQCALILGGQGDMWGETVDMSDLEQTVWPKLAAIAERLWSPRTYP